MEKKAQMSFRSGFIAIIGRPNAGKSTLLNRILGEKVSIVSAKPQTTRNIIRGVKNIDGCQMIFIDTPGIHRGKGLLNRFMVKEALSSVKDVDGIIYIVDAMKPGPGEDADVFKGLKGLKSPVILALNKVDRLDKRLLLPMMEEYMKLFAFKEMIPVSALNGDGIEVLMEVLKGMMPEGPRYFPEDVITDQPERFIAAEMIREKVFRLTKDEVPYSVAVTIDRFEEKKGKGLVSISATINVERDSQKGIVIGRGGAMLKRIGTEARADIEEMLGSRVYLELFVRVQQEWTKKPGALEEFGYRGGRDE